MLLKKRKKMDCEKKMKAPLALLGILIFVFTLLQSVSAASVAEVVISDASAYQGDTTSAFIRINNAENAGVIDLNLYYNPSVVKVIDVTGSDFDTTIPNREHNDTGSVRIGAFQTENPGLNKSVITVEKITLKAVGNAGSTSPLNIGVTEFKDATPEGKHINYTITNGTFAVKSSNGGSGSGDSGSGGGSSPHTTPTEKPSAAEKVEVAATPSPTLVPTTTPPSPTPAQTPAPIIPAPPAHIPTIRLFIILIAIVSALIVLIGYLLMGKKKPKIII
jgi:hypothetical protein